MMRIFAAWLCHQSTGIWGHSTSTILVRRKRQYLLCSSVAITRHQIIFGNCEEGEATLWMLYCHTRAHLLSQELWWLGSSEYLLPWQRWCGEVWWIEDCWPFWHLQVTSLQPEWVTALLFLKTGILEPFSIHRVVLFLSLLQNTTQLITSSHLTVVILWGVPIISGLVMCFAWNRYVYM